MSELAQVLAELDLMSHVAAVNLNPLARETTDDIGGKRPPGGVDYREDGHRDFSTRPEDQRVLRSASHFRDQLARGRAPSRVLLEARASLEAWRRMPPPSSEPEYGSQQWKRWVAESPLSHKELARKFNCSRGYIAQIRRQYRGDEAA